MQVCNKQWWENMSKYKYALYSVSVVSNNEMSAGCVIKSWSISKGYGDENG